MHCVMLLDVGDTLFCPCAHAAEVEHRIAPGACPHCILAENRVKANNAIILAIFELVFKSCAEVHGLRAGSLGLNGSQLRTKVLATAPLRLLLCLSGQFLTLLRRRCLWLSPIRGHKTRCRAIFAAGVAATRTAAATATATATAARMSSAATTTTAIREYATPARVGLGSWNIDRTHVAEKNILRVSHRIFMSRPGGHAVLRTAAKVRYERLPPSAYAPPMSVAHLNQKPVSRFSCSLFNLKIYPLIEYPSRERMQPLVGPPWLPLPISLATHSRRHLLRAEALRMAKEHTRVVQALPHDHDAATLLLRGTVFISKKNVNRSAVVRSRCRTRLIHALRLVLAAGNVPVMPMHGYVFHGAAALYNVDKAEIISDLRRALVSISRARPLARSSA